jgi:hypothetical protein
MNRQLAHEAVTIGAVLTPVYAVVRELVEELNFENERSKDYISVFVAGALFHILAEATGVNEYYIKHSHVARKWMSKKSKDVDTHPDCPDGRLCAMAVWASRS